VAPANRREGHGYQEKDSEKAAGKEKACREEGNKKTRAGQTSSSENCCQKEARVA
jgi:hypothetical protein